MQRIDGAPSSDRIPVGVRERTQTALVIGGFGALGSAVSSQLVIDGFTVLRSSRSVRQEAPDAVVFADDIDTDALPVLDAVVWAHGINVNDSAAAFIDDDLDRLLHVNVTVIARGLRDLLAAGRLAAGARVVVLSSIWQDIARSDKYSYTISKAAVGGLVRAAAMDLAPRGILVNAVLPGVVDTPMTRSMLSAEQIERVESATPAGRIVGPDDVANVVGYLASRRNTAVTGQSLTVDLGFSVGRTL